MKKVGLISGALLLLCFGGAAAFVFSRQQAAFESSWPYLTALHATLADPQIAAALGAPVTPGRIAGTLDSHDPHRTEAKLAVPLAGTQHQGTLRIEAHTTATAWELDRCEVEVEGAAAITVRRP